MGCDIHLIAQRKLPTEAPIWAESAASSYADIEGEFFDCRDYGLFGFWVGVTNYSGLTPLSEPRGIPDDFHAPDHAFREDYEYACDYHSRSWFSVQELLDVDYDQIIEDRRCSKEIAPNVYSGAETCEPGEGKQQTLREFLGNWYFRELERLKETGADRIVFCFDC
jgi:hypothetical protein